MEELFVFDEELIKDDQDMFSEEEITLAPNPRWGLICGWNCDTINKDYADMS